MKINIAKVISAVVLGFLLQGAHAQGRTVPECLNEQLAMDSVLAALATAAVDPEVKSGAKSPPGTWIMGTFGDPAFQSGRWEKREWNQYFHETRRTLRTWSVTITRFVVSIHFMWNRDTQTATQIKFATSTEQGCVGVKKVADASEGVGLEQTPAFSFWKANANNNGMTYLAPYIRTSNAQVNVGPLVAAGTSSISYFGSGAPSAGAPIGSPAAGGDCGSAHCIPQLPSQ